MVETVTASQSYMAARETCARLYVATGGDPKARWTVAPFRGTAAIAKNIGYFGETTWQLHMPAMPLDARLTRREADVMAAFVVHELGHALFTAFGPGEGMAQASKEGISRLLNAIEDARIERKLAQCSTVPEARKLLEGLTSYIVERDTAAGYDLTAPKSFAFTLCNVLLTDGLGYTVPAFPAAWRHMLPAGWVRVLENCLLALPGLNSTADALDLARWVQREMAQGGAATPPVSKPPAKGGAGQREGEQGEPEGAQDEGAGQREAQDEGEGEGKRQDEKQAPAQAPDEAPGEAPVCGDTDGEGEQGEGGGEQAGAGGEGVDLTDAAQDATEPDLSDIAADVCDRAGADPAQVDRANKPASEFLNCQPSMIGLWPEIKRNGARKMAEAIDAPAKLRRDVRAAVKAPERVGVERYQTTGRLDMRNMSQFATSQALFSRRFEEEGREAAVSLLLDLSSSMGSGRGSSAEAAGALALHLGEALKSAGVPFEVAGFADTHAYDGAPICRLYVAKAFADGWADPVRSRIALMMNKAAGGTAMLPALHDMAGRLAKRPHVTRRILLVLTDGADGYPVAANQAAIKHWAAKGVEVIGLGCLTDVSATFGPGRHVNVYRLSDVATAGLRALVGVLNPTRPVRKSAA